MSTGTHGTRTDGDPPTATRRWRPGASRCCTSTGPRCSRSTRCGSCPSLIDEVAERIQTLGGVAVGDPRHVAEITELQRPPDGAEDVPSMLSRLLEGHEIIIGVLREAIEKTDENGDAGTNDLLTGTVLRRHEMHTWFVAEHLVDVPVVREDPPRR
ncbi:Dps family protein [Pseudonocardia sp. T1-2H]|uniref:Dps family protein n=1 Tax=Pseudonocardia sp. T1-2H TaxID=3128899 RepID=UPI003100D14C